MTGAYLRVERNGKWENVEIEYLTPDERKKIFKDKPEDTYNWFEFVCQQLKSIAEFIDKQPEL